MLTRYAPTGAVAAANHLAAQAGASVLERGGNAADAPGQPTVALNASGRAGSGSDAARLRAEGVGQMPFRDDVRSVTVPGCVDGLVALGARFGTMPPAEVLTPAIRLARDGFPVSP